MMFSVHSFHRLLSSVLFVLVVSLSMSTSAFGDGPVKQARLNLYETSMISKILAENRNRDLSTNLKAVEATFSKLRNTHGNLSSLAVHFEELKGNPFSRHLHAFVLGSDQQYQRASEVLGELAAKPDPDPWVTAELARIRQLVELKAAWDLLGAESELPDLSGSQKKAVDGILLRRPEEGRAQMEEIIPSLLSHYGDLTPLLDYLREVKPTPVREIFIAKASLKNGDLSGAEKTLEPLVEKTTADSWLLGELGRIKEMRGRTEEAAALFQRALKTVEDPNVRFALSIRTSQLLYDLDQRKEAALTLKAIAATEGEASIERRNFCARIAGLHGDHSLVAEWFQPTGEGRALRLNQLFLGESLLQVGRFHEAHVQFKNALLNAKVPRDRRYVLDRIVGVSRTMNELPRLADEWLKSDQVSSEQLEILMNVVGGELGQVGRLFSFVSRDDLPEKTLTFIKSPEFQERLAILGAGSNKDWDAAGHYLKLMGENPKEASYRDGYVRLLLMNGDRPAAIRVYREAMGASGEATGLMEVANGARRVGLMEVAREAAAKAAEKSGKNPLNAGLFTVALYREQGEADLALGVLRDLQGKLADDDADGMIMLAEAYERLDDRAAAIELCRGAYELAGSELILRKLIALLEQQNLYGDAFELWRKLWQTAREPMTIVQANNRLLELGSRSGRLADLAIELEDRLVAEGLKERELTLLLDIYTSVGDPVSAADVLMEMSKSKDGDPVATQKRLFKVFMESELFGKCNRILRKLIEIDPENWEEHLQLLAVIALERGNNGDAIVVLEELARRTKDGILRDSFSASVLKMLGKPTDAANAFRRGMADNTDDIESWLMWGNALAARDEREREQIRQQGKRPPAPESQAGNVQTRGVFAVMLEEAEADDLFVICVDGLLNARAPRQSMLNALRRLNERIAAKPHNLLLHRLAADINEDVNRPEEGARVLRAALTIAGDSRPFIMRELMSMAGAADQPDEKILIGRSLLNIAKHLPPDECLSLGTMLLRRGHAAEAEVAFQRVVGDANAVGVAQRVALQYENSGLFEKAIKVIQTLIIGNPFDVQLQLRLALLEEKNGNFERAHEIYRESLTQLTTKFPRKAAPSGNKGGRALSVSDVDRFLDLTVRSVIATARSRKDREQLLEVSRQRIQNEIKELESQKAIAANISGNPRLANLAMLLRRFASIFHQPDVADEVDGQLFQLYPEDVKLRGVAGQARQKWQTKIAAGRFLKKHGVSEGLHSVIDPFTRGRGAVVEMISRSSLSPTERSAAATLSAMFGYDDQIEKVLAGFDLKKIPQAEGELLVTVGLATGRSDLVSDVILTNLNRLRKELEPLAGFDRGRAYLRPAKLFRQIVASWPALSPQDRSTATNLFGMTIGEAEKTGTMASAHHFLLALSGRSHEIKIETLQMHLKNRWNYFQGHITTIFDYWLEEWPEEERSAALRKLLDTANDKDRAIMLEQLARCIPLGNLNDEIIEEFPELAKRPWEFLVTGDHSSDATPEEQREKIAGEIKAALRRMGSDARRLFVLHDLTLRPAANTLPRAQLDLLIKEYEHSRDPFERVVVFLLLKHAGRDIEAFALMQDLAAMPPENDKAEAALAALPQFLRSYGWNLQALEMDQKASSAPIRNLNADFFRHDPLAILENTEGTILEINTRRMHAARLLRSPEQFQQAGLIYRTDTRHPDVVLNRRMETQALMWPPRVTMDPAGLAASREKSGKSVLVDLVEQEGGQDELLNWLSSISPSWLTNQREMAEEIVADARECGMSPDLRRRLEVAVEKSAINVFDLELIEAIARLSPEMLPRDFAKQVEELALQNWRGGSQWSSRLSGVRKRKGLHQDPAERMASLAVLCQSIGRKDLARAFGRWSIAMELIEGGSPSHLEAYLETFPVLDRRKILSGFLPFLGLHEARVHTGEGFGNLLQILLKEGMTDEASQQVDSYLRFRLPLKKSYWSRPPGSALDAMVGGLSSDSKVKDDDVAITLARLNRPEDYQHLLWKKNQDAKYSRSALNLSMSVSPSTLIDNTGALPEPSDVGDINLYLDLHLALVTRLRETGIIDAERQVAHLCLLVQWCLKRELSERALAFLDIAEELSVDMLTGRLGVAEVQRLMGREELAMAVEIELLSKNLLPLPRVPAALDALARKQGGFAADFRAFRWSRFTNHSEVLTRALRHARAEEMKSEFQDLTERLRQVSTLFLPSDAPCPFEGYQSVAAWSAEMSAIAAKFPERPKPKSLASLVDDQHPAIARAFLKGEKPEMIYVPILHDEVFSHLSTGGAADLRKVLENCQEISDRLYKRYGVRNIQLEGLSKTFVERYNRIPLQRRNIAGETRGMIVHQTWTRVLEQKGWTLLPASDRPMVGDLTALGRKYEVLIVGALDEAKGKGWFRSRESYDQNVDELKAKLSAIAEEYNAAHTAILEKDPKLKKEYEVTVTQRNKAFLDYLLTPKEPGVVFFGSGHWQDLEKQLEERGVSYAVVVPRGLTWPPVVKDEERIYDDMLGLGAKLKKCTITLGGGEVIELDIPIH